MFERRDRPFLFHLTTFAFLTSIILPLGLWRLEATDVVSMEGIVADGARYMRQNETYLVPRLHGEIYAYKPPLAYWLALVSTQWFGGENEWTLRLPFALSGILMALVVFFVVSARLGSRVGLTCGLASITGVLAIQKLRIAEFDMPLAAGVGIASALAMAELTAHKSSSWRWTVAYAALSLAFLAKGIPALMFYVPGILLASAWTGSTKRLISVSHLAGVALFLTVCGAWIFGAWIADGQTAFAQPWSEAGTKGLTWSIESFGATLLKPAILFGAFLPWTLVLPSALRTRNRYQLDSESRAMARAAGGFVAGGLLVFMAVPATETRYLLPLTGPLGVLCGILLHALVSPLTQHLTRGLATIMGLLLVLGAPALARTGQLEYPSADTPWLVVTGVGLIALAVLMHRLPLAATARMGTLVLAIAIGFGVAQILAIEPHRAASRSQRDLAYSFHAAIDSTDADLWVGPVSGGFHHSSLIFYLQQSVRTFFPYSPPPDGARVILFSDEPPGTDGHASFEYTVLEAQKHRGVQFELVEVSAEQFTTSTSVPTSTPEPFHGTK